MRINFYLAYLRSNCNNFTIPANIPMSTLALLAVNIKYSMNLAEMNIAQMKSTEIIQKIHEEQIWFYVNELVHDCVFICMLT